MNEQKTRGRPPKAPRSLDDEIAEAEAKLQALRTQQLEEKSKRAREHNRVGIVALINAEGLDAAAPERWMAVLPQLRELLDVEAPAPASAETPMDDIEAAAVPTADAAAPAESA